MKVSSGFPGEAAEPLWARRRPPWGTDSGPLRSLRSDLVRRRSAERKVTIRAPCRRLRLDRVGGSLAHPAGRSDMGELVALEPPRKGPRQRFRPVDGETQPLRAGEADGAPPPCD